MMLTFITEAQAMIEQAMQAVTPGPLATEAAQMTGSAEAMAQEPPLELPPEMNTAPPSETLPS